MQKALELEGPCQRGGCRWWKAYLAGRGVTLQAHLHGILTPSWGKLCGTTMIKPREAAESSHRPGLAGQWRQLLGAWSVKGEWKYHLPAGLLGDYMSSASMKRALQAAWQPHSLHGE